MDCPLCMGDKQIISPEGQLEPCPYCVLKDPLTAARVAAWLESPAHTCVDHPLLPCPACTKAKS